jgi:hypothetical protein
MAEIMTEIKRLTVMTLNAQKPNTVHRRRLVQQNASTVATTITTASQTATTTTVCTTRLPQHAAPELKQADAALTGKIMMEITESIATTPSAEKHSIA